MTTTFIGVYRGRTVAEAELVCVTSEERVVAQVMSALLGEKAQPQGDTHARLHLLRPAPETEERDE